MQKSIKLMNDYGFTLFSGGVGGPYINGYNNGSLSIDFTNADKAWEELSHYGIDHLLSYGGMNLGNFNSYAPEDTESRYGKSYTGVMGDIMSAINSHTSANGYPDYYLTVGDEPYDETAAVSVRSVIKETDTMKGFTSTNSKSSEIIEPLTLVRGVMWRLVWCGKRRRNIL